MKVAAVILLLFVAKSTSSKRALHETPKGRSETDDVCKLPAEQGPCEGRVLRWYYDFQTNQCMQFNYGCEGNGNNFESYDDCKEKCITPKVPKAEESPCDQPKRVGACAPSVGKWYYNEIAQKCEYGACEAGNSNSFETRDECERRCLRDQRRRTNVCEQPKDPGPCMASFRRYFYNTRSKQCEVFAYGGCQGNGNNFETLYDCEDRCYENKKEEAEQENPCKMRADPGPCDGVHQRYFYDWEDKKCATFTYGGCKGNENNFLALADCEARCLGKKKEAERLCEQPADPGPCLASFIRYYYNKDKMMCEKFVYGGCRGNGNNFETIIECERRCSATNMPPAIGEGCKVAKDPGSCKKNITKWYFSRKRLVCKPFFYTGCGGNANRYDTKDQCEQECIAPLPARAICSLPYAAGTCRNDSRRWFYDFERKECRAFSYTGCKGNANNFLGEDECRAKCASV